MEQLRYRQQKVKRTENILDTGSRRGLPFLATTTNAN
jgi:hypothetical protein